VPVLLATGVWTGLGAAERTAATAAPTGLTAQLVAGQEVPKPKGVRAGAKGTFTATLARSGAGGTLSWRLTFQSLTGPVTGAHVHAGARGKAGPVRISLCGPCRSGARGSARADARTVAALLAGTAYVNLHTARNPAGELRGQVAKTAKTPRVDPPPTVTGTSSGTITYEETYEPR
jgi:hypothetical protein